MRQMPAANEVLKRVKKIEIKTGKLVEGIISGNYRSVFKGRGIEFSGVREYAPGDDIRAIDWNVTARLNAPFVKDFIEERNLSVFIVFDLSGSSDFGYQKSKKETGVELAASIMLAALKNNDSVGLCLFTDRIEKLMRPRKGKKHVLRLLRELIYYEPKSRKTDINESLTSLGRIIKKRSIVFVISDYLAGSFEKPLNFLKNRHDIILISLVDIREEEIPDIGYVLLEDHETGEQVLVNSASRDFRRLYSEKLLKAQDELAGRMKRLKLELVKVRSDQPFHVPLRKFFRRRERRRR